MSLIIAPKEKKVKSFWQIQKPLRLVFFGTPDFARIILKHLLKVPQYEAAAVVTTPDKPKNRGQKPSASPVKNLAEQNKIRILQPAKAQDKNFIRQLKEINADVFLTAAYGQILPQNILNLPRFGALNVHASLLPKYRGASPIQAAILNGDEQTGVSVILMTEQMDAGPIILQKEIKINTSETGATLHDRLAVLGAQAAQEAIDLWIVGKDISAALNAQIARPQDETKATYTKKITKQDGQIDWQKSATEIERQIRAFYSWPGSFFSANDRIFKIIEAEILPEQKTAGRLFLTKNNRPAVGCGQDALLIKKIQPAGGRILTGQEFVNGYKNLFG
ncbi:MAG: methionyl-tRNA formyltransferase [Candidatus Portnoybacteria bacterium CG10_big_fil_rev_8_21_14_0_10_44_7]|uniref:Methionyl-tRNA formyltransferase n=1 Tax=Candidatus Portnoybacteria bacterium CG10_big_fil_rev_8_21_14_0_10_44_7 TaxID=1974816 RepID=A0A2M8KJ48_9BACT|nr:MAG: methionyl-tRNA formyltransferase [Candidatus Portnoybacteria bacterium CG10_big_fil_rev_8_21_14_0_10_44_7]